TAAMRQAVGNASLPKVSQALRQYMQDNLQSTAIMQDTQHERLEFMTQHGIDMQVLSYGYSSPQNLSPEQAVPLSQLAND
ncbi:amidohydrolase, partial [Lactiplantibacillus paraplantarum]